MAVARMLHCMPAYALGNEPPRVYIPGEIGSQQFKFEHPVVLYASGFNPGAREMTTQFSAGYSNDGNLKLLHRPTPQLRPGARRPSRKLVLRSIPRKLSASGKHLARSSSNLDGDEQATHMLLYLNCDTFEGDTGARLAYEVSRARAHGIAI
eukprot:2937402-Prymnesium_polylepis.1